MSIRPRVALGFVLVFLLAGPASSRLGVEEDPLWEVHLRDSFAFFNVESPDGELGAETVPYQSGGIDPPDAQDVLTVGWLRDAAGGPDHWRSVQGFRITVSHRCDEVGDPWADLMVDASHQADWYIPDVGVWREFWDTLEFERCEGSQNR